MPARFDHDCRCRRSQKYWTKVISTLSCALVDGVGCNPTAAPNTTAPKIASKNIFLAFPMLLIRKEDSFCYQRYYISSENQNSPPTCVKIWRIGVSSLNSQSGGLFGWQGFPTHIIVAHVEHPLADNRPRVISK